MKKYLFVIALIISVIQISGCNDSSTTTDETGGGGTGSGGTGSGGNDTSSGWSVVVSSGSQVLANPKYSGGATGGEVAGSFDIFILPSNTNMGWAVGNLGEVLKSTDGGESAAVIESFPSSSIQRSVRAVSADSVWVAGRDSLNDGASIFATSDGGTTWSVQFNTAASFPNRSITSTDRINALDFVSATAGFAAGGLGDNTNLILKTTNAGATWTSVYREATSGTDDELQSIFFIVDTDVGFAVGNTGVILKSTDGGATWMALSSGVTENLHEVRCVDINTCYVAGGAGIVLKTTDGGTTWTALSTGTTEELAALNVDGNNIWAGGGNGTILYSSDAGTTWTAQTTDTTFVIQAIYMITENMGFAACASTTSNTGAILKTTTGGK